MNKKEINDNYTAKRKMLSEKIRLLKHFDNVPALLTKKQYEDYMIRYYLETHDDEGLRNYKNSLEKTSYYNKQKDWANKIKSLNHFANVPNTITEKQYNDYKIRYESERTKKECYNEVNKVYQEKIEDLKIQKQEIILIETNKKIEEKKDNFYDVFKDCLSDITKEKVKKLYKIISDLFQLGKTKGRYVRKYIDLIFFIEKQLRGRIPSEMAVINHFNL